MRGDFVADDASPDILFVWETEMFFRCYVAEHRRPVPADLRRADCTGNVIVAGSDVSHERAQGIEGRLETLAQASSMFSRMSCIGT